ncbi:unnamed protein product [Pleuronectes platessa]|uniref:Uncharacterized protein n=1 Tax=Pleuronectes platessa TaxID=8262 RepID=A0A9N7YQ20_PLEPL|nr:unnamed protein product [Pleuronectes platessa]
MGRQQRVHVCSCRSEGVGGRGQGGGREVPAVLLLLLQGAVPTYSSASLDPDPPRLEASPPQELEDPQMKSRARERHF